MKKLFLPVYFFTLFLFVIFSYLFTDQNLSYFHNIYTGFATNSRTIATMTYIIFVLLFFVFYYLILKYQKGISIKKLILVTSGILFLTYPAILSYDIFNYIATSKVLFYYHENPYLIMPIDFINEPILVFTRAANKLALYGIFWTFISGVPYFLSFGNYIISIFTFKIFIAAFYFGISYLIWKLTRNKLSVILFAANPLVIIETFISGHNDVVMMFFALLAVYSLKNKRIFLAVIFLVLSIFIKYATLFLAPLFLLTVIQYAKNKKIDWSKFYLWAFFSMLAIFVLSFLREEIYPWYAVWPLTFLVLIPQKRKFINIFLGLSYGLMLAYIPYMYFGTYFGTTPFAKILLMLFPPVGIFLYQTIKANKRSIL